jgi:chondroitin AC lyase
LKRIVLILVLFAVPVYASLDTVRQNFINYYSAAGADREAGRMRDALAALETSARAYSAPGYLLSDGSWSDINYSDTPTGSWSPWDHFRRLTVMAKAYRTPGQSLYGDPQLRASIESALSYVPTFYGPLTAPLGNWWFWTIGAALDLGPTLVLMRGDIDQMVYDDCVRTLLVHIGTSPTARGLVGPVPVGENLVWSSYTHLCLALVLDDAALLTQVREAMASVCTTTVGDGIQSDRSFHQHGPQLYTGGYGGSFANDVTRYALLTRGTEFALPPAVLSNVADYLADGIAWSLYGNYFDVSVVGREVARVSTTGYNGVAALVQASQFSSPRQSEIRAATAQMLRSWQWTLPPELAALAVDAETMTVSPAWPAGHQHYFDSDYTVHRRPGWFASIKMFSARTKSGERTNDENILGSRQSDGRFYLVLDGDEYFGSNVWPAFDWTRLPGITVEQKADAANDTYGFGTRTLVGGTGDGRNGVSAMDYAPLNSSLTAKKSWFFFDDTIVFLTNSITCTSGNRVETVVDQRPSWATPIRYWFYGHSPRVEQITRTGTWAALGASTDSAPHTATFQTIWFDHGTNPAGDHVEYAISPGPAVFPPTIVANDGTASAVRAGNMLGIVFWKPGRVEGIQSDAPAVVYLTDRDIYVADPTNGVGTFTVTVGSRTLTVPRSGGRTFHAALGGRRRAAR